MTDSSDADLLNIFWIEVNEYLQSLNMALLQVETVSPGDASLEETLREMNRVAHSMKGAARAVGISVIETVSHYMEEVFEAALNKTLELTPEVADSLYDGLDLIQNVVNGEENKSETVATYRCWTSVELWSEKSRMRMSGLRRWLRSCPGYPQWASLTRRYS